MITTPADLGDDEIVAAGYRIIHDKALRRSHVNPGTSVSRRTERGRKATPGALAGEVTRVSEALATG